jgi:serine phosphatase RsbU (regulator of sigma subunit)
MTDGVTEAANAEGEQFGRNRVGEYLQAWSQCSADETVERLQSAVDSHLGDKTAVDDVTILGLRFCGADS